MNLEKNQTLTAMKREFDLNLDWAKSKIKIGQENRFSAVQKKLDFLVARYDESTMRLTEDIDSPDLFKAALEGRNFNKAVRFLKSLNENHLPKNKLKRMFIGPDWYIDENIKDENTEGRDIQFEFILSDYLTNRGLKIVKHDDIEFELNSSPIQFECKRPWFTKNFKQSFDLAVNQLEKKIKERKYTYGFLALSIDKYENLEDKLFRGSDGDAVIGRLRQILNDLRKNLRANMMLSSSKKIAGVLFYLKTFLWNPENGSFTEFTLHGLEKMIHEKKDPLMDLLYRELLEVIQVD